MVKNPNPSTSPHHLTPDSHVLSFRLLSQQSLAARRPDRQSARRAFLRRETAKFSGAGSRTFSRAKLRRTFETCGQIWAEGNEPKWPYALIDVTRAEVRAFHIPWYYFGGGAVIDLGHGPMRFSFIRPQNTVFPSHYSEDLQQWVGGEGQEEVNIPEGKLAGKRWRALLT